MPAADMGGPGPRGLGPGDRERGPTHDGEAHDEGPEAGPRVALRRLPDGLLVLAVLAVEGIGHEVLVGQDVGLLMVTHGDVVPLGQLILWFGIGHLRDCSLCGRVGTRGLGDWIGGGGGDGEQGE